MIQMALNGEGEPTPTLLQEATQAVTIELFRQWQTYRNGVHMTWDTFRSIDFEALALEALGTAGLKFTGDEVTGMPKLQKQPDKPSPFAQAQAHKDTAAYDALMARSDATKLSHLNLYGLSDAAIAEHGEQVQG